MRSNALERIIIPGREIKSEEDEKDIEFEKETLDILIEGLLARAVKINEGNNGIIKKFSIDDMDETIRQYIFKSVPELLDKKGEYVAKMLKIYTGGKGRKEFKMQRATYELVKKTGDPENYAKVPRPYMYYDMEIRSDEVREQLTREGLKHLKNNVEILIMDFIDGPDFVTFLHREALKKMDEVNIDDEEIDKMPVRELISYISVYLRYEKPAGNKRDEQERIFEDEKVKGLNAEKLVTFLKKNGFVLDENILRRLTNTLNLMKKNGISHNDLHERNVMLTMKDEGVDDVFLIDFADSKYKHEKDSGLEEKRYVSDDVIISRYSALTTKEDPKSVEYLRYIGEIQRIKGLLETRNIDLVKEIKKQLAEIKNGEDVINLISSKSSKLSLDSQLNIGYILSELSDINKELAIECLNVLLQKKMLKDDIKNKIEFYITSK